MKKSLLLSIACLLSVFNVHVLAQTNLLANGDFEAWTGDVPDNWKSTTSASTATLKKSTDAHGGSYSVSVGGQASANKRLAYKELTLKAGEYTMQFYAKGGRCCPGYIPIKDDGSIGIGYYGDYATLKTDEWTLVSHEFTLSTKTKVNIVVMNPRSNSNQNYTAADAIIDDVTLTTFNGGVDDRVLYNDIYYICDDNNAIVTTMSPNKYKGDVIIPDSITVDEEIYYVTGIGNRAFYGCSALTSITIPNSVKTIGEYAFAHCTGLTSITIPNSITDIYSQAFYSCTNLTSVTLNSDAIVSKNYTTSSNLPSIFGSQVTNYVLGDNVTSIGDYALYNSTKLTNITIPNSVTRIGENAFNGCAALTSVTLSESLSELGDGAFTGCSQAKIYVQKDEHVALLVWEKGYDCYDVTTTELILKPTLSVVSTTQCTATLTIENNSESYVLKVGGDVVYNSGSITLSDLKPQTAGEINLYASCKDEEKWYEIGSCQYTTANISPTATTKATGSSITLTPSYIQGDAAVTEQKMTFNGATQDVEAGKEYHFTSLSPNRNYSVTYTLTANGYDFTYNGYVRCEQLVLNSQQPKVINTGNVIVAAKTNLDEAETNVGFEWRRTDWTDDFNSKSGGAYLYEGTIEGYIRDLNTEKLWKYRPFYESADGTRHYGEWVGIDPTDTSYFDPTVHTYASIDVQGNTASVRGYVMRGTDNVTEQGFKYWKASDNVRNYDGEVLKAVTIPIDAQTITASGQVMTASLSGLDYETDYYCVAFVTTSEGTVFYGEQQAFRTGVPPTGVDDVAGIEDSKARTIEGYYNLQGQRINEPQRGVNIIRYSDGTTKKVLLK